MGTMLAVLIETGSRPSFWADMAARNVHAAASDVPRTVLVDCRSGDFVTPQRLAEEWSRALSSKTIALVAQTTASVMAVHAFDNGNAIRRIEYQDDAGWTRMEGAAQPWEPALFFDDTTEAACRADDGSWPSVISDEITDEDLARYWSAKAKGDAIAVLDLLTPDHLGPLYRLCAFHGLDAATPSASWKKPSLLSRMFGR
jgi:hypothetical protein